MMCEHDMISLYDKILLKKKSQTNQNQKTTFLKLISKLKDTYTSLTHTKALVEDRGTVAVPQQHPCVRLAAVLPFIMIGDIVRPVSVIIMQMDTLLSRIQVN